MSFSVAYNVNKISLIRCPATKSQLSFINFAINKFFMKLLQTSNVNYSQQMFCFDLPSVMLARCTGKFMCRLCQCDNYMIKYAMSV